MHIPHIFLDLDGVAADFERYFEDYFGFRHDSVSDEVMWKLINNHGNFFANLPPLPGAIDFFWNLYNTKGFDQLFILTACPRTNYYTAASQKIDWTHSHLDPNLHVLPVLGGKNKCLFMHRPGDILIDDFEKNLIPWVERGGRAVHHTGDYEATLKKVVELIQ